MAGLVVRRPPLVLGVQHLLALGADQDAVGGPLEVDAVDLGLAVAGGAQGGLVGQVAQVGAGHADGLAGDQLQVDVVGQRLVARVDLEDGHAALPGRAVDGDVAVEAARAQQGGVQDVGGVGRRHDDDRLGGREAVHLAEDLVERLLALVGAAADAGAAHAAHGVDLVDEKDAVMGN